MNNIETGVIDTIGDFAPIVGESTQFPWTEFGKKRVDGRTENNQLQEFGFQQSSVGNGNVAFGLDCIVKLNSRQARTEINVDGKYLGKKNRKIVKKNDLITHKPFEAHAFKAKTKSKMLAFADGLRGGKNYEKDTFRLNNKLI